MELLRTTLCYIEKGDKYLMMHRIKKENDVNKDKWIGIGGKLLEGETPEQCVVREVREETGIRLTDPVYRGVVDFHCPPYPSERMYLYTCSEGGYCGGDALPDCPEGALEWVDKGRVSLLPIWEGDKIFLRLIAEGSPVFGLELFYSGDRLEKAVLDGKTL